VRSYRVFVCTKPGVMPQFAGHKDVIAADVNAAVEAALDDLARESHPRTAWEIRRIQPQ
jgi:hypothetical protein